MTCLMVAAEKLERKWQLQKRKATAIAALQIEFSIFVFVPKRQQRNFSQSQKQCSFHGSGTRRSALVHSLTGPRAERGPGGQGQGEHAGPRPDREGDGGHG